MARKTIQIPANLKSKMNQHETTNWSNFIRKRIKQEVDHPNPPRKIKQFINENILNSEHRIELAWALHLLIRNSKEYCRNKTASQLFEEMKLKQPLVEMESKLDSAGLGELDQDVGRGLTVKQALKEELADSGLIDEIKNSCNQRIRDASREDRRLVWLLAHYVADDLDKNTVSVKPHGIAKAYALVTQQEYDVDRVTNILTELGLFYHGHHDTTQYSYRSHIVPNYALSLLEDVANDDKNIVSGAFSPESNEIRTRLNEKEFIHLLNWLDGSHKYVVKDQEDSEIDQSHFDNITDFHEYVGQLIRKGIIIVKYRPHRSSKGGNSGARPAKWKYEIDKGAYPAMGKAVIEEDMINF
jgi:hypothetical protein